MTSAPDLFSLRGRPVIIGAGVAGLLTALHMGDHPCVLVSCAGHPAGGTLPGTVTDALGLRETPGQRAARTFLASDGLACPEAVQAITGAIPGIEASLRAAGIDLGQDGCDTGAGFHLALLKAVHARPNIAIISPVILSRLVLLDGHVRGVVLRTRTGEEMLETDAVILATGGAGGLYGGSLLPESATGSGLAVAVRAGAQMTDMEFVGFHPLVLTMDDGPASGLPVPFGLYGAEALLVDDQDDSLKGTTTDPFFVARAIAERRAAGHEVFLDLRKSLASGRLKDEPSLELFLRECRARGVAPERDALPVSPAAAFHIGGIRASIAGRTSLPGLWACGEVACTGFHGAGVAEGNPLLETVVCAGLVAENVQERTVLPRQDISRLEPESPGLHGVLPEVRRDVASALGTDRTQGALIDAVVHMTKFSPFDDAALVAEMMLLPALRREECRGVHFRSDFQKKDKTARHLSFTMAEAFTAARMVSRDHPLSWSLDVPARENTLSA